MNREKRKVERLLTNLEFESCSMSLLRKDDQFRMFEPTGEPVQVLEDTIFVAYGNAFLNEDQIWTIECKPLSEHLKESDKS